MLARSFLSAAIACCWVCACTSLVDQDLSEVRCQDVGAVGPPACDYDQICVANRCSACMTREVCGDKLDNDCNGRVDDGCLPSASGGSTAWPEFGVPDQEGGATSVGGRR